MTLMTALLVLATFAVFLLIDYLHGRKPAVVEARAAARKAPIAPRLQPAFVGGFEVRNNLRYHPGHTWALGESPNFVRVGMDDFAARLVGTVDEIAIPMRGQWLRQGQKLATVTRNGGKAELVSPIEGEVTGLNEAVLKDPSLIARDPYGEGWLVTVQAPDAKTNFRNLLSGALARRWMEDAAARLRTRLSTVAVAGAMAQDGGVAVQNMTDHLPSEAWNKLAREFFLT
jgi:glycine cleavage system H protein